MCVRVCVNCCFTPAVVLLAIVDGSGKQNPFQFQSEKLTARSRSSPCGYPDFCLARFDITLFDSLLSLDIGIVLSEIGLKLICLILVHHSVDYHEVLILVQHSVDYHEVLILVQHSVDCHDVILLVQHSVDYHEVLILVHHSVDYHDVLILVLHSVDCHDVLILVHHSVDCHEVLILVQHSVDCHEVITTCSCCFN